MMLTGPAVMVVVGVIVTVVALPLTVVVTFDVIVGVLVLVDVASAVKTTVVAPPQSKQCRLANCVSLVV